jgi:glycosyltransferase involved in cell wall biosynthesis
VEIVTIIPAYNEEKTIGNVLSVLKQVNEIARIIVVSDGSTDETVDVAKSFGVEVVELEENIGKGGAMKAGVERTLADIVLFLDADLIGLTPSHVLSLLKPVIKNEAEMSIGIFEKGRIATDLAQKMAPFLSGQRAIRRALLDQVCDMEIARFGVEVALHHFVENNNIKVKEVLLTDMSHVMKEEKLGVWKGMAARMKMYWEIIKYYTHSNSLRRED